MYLCYLKIRKSIIGFLKKTYNEIEEITGTSTATISRINRCLSYGADGYNLVLDRLEKKEG